jgi:hypothetical protein
MKKSLFNTLQIMFFLLGVGLFVYLVKQTGLSNLARYLAMTGWGFAWILALSAVRNCARAGSWYFSIDPGQRQITFWQIMNVMLAGEAIKYLTATGPLLSEPAKAAMARRSLPLLQGFSSVLIENLIYYLTVFIFMLAGLPALALLTQVPGNLELAGYGILSALALAVLLIWLAIRWRWFVVARALEQLSQLTARRERDAMPQRRIEMIALQVRAVEDNLYSFYERRRAAFFLIFSLNMCAHAINIIEVCIILALLKLPAQISIGFVVEAATKVINMVFFFVPTRAGVYESGNAALLQSLGMTAAAGVALAIIRKLRAFVWIGYGLVVIGVVALSKGTEKANGDNRVPRT